MSAQARPKNDPSCEDGLPVILGQKQHIPKKVAKPLVQAEKPWWKVPFAVTLAMGAGVLLVIQGGINTNLRMGISDGKYPTAAACVSFSVGSFCTLCLACINMPRLGNTTVRKCPWYGWIGGLLGPFYVTGAVLLVPRLGFAVFQLCVIIGMLGCSLTLDTIGFLFLPKKKLSFRRLFSIAALIAGAILTTSSLDTKGRPFWQALMCLAAVIIGTVFPIQGCCNGVLVKHILSPFRAIGVTFGCAAILLAMVTVVWCLVIGEPFTLNFDTSDFWMFIGGACGATLVTCNAIGIPILGAAAFTTMFLATQLVTAVICDAFGAFNFEPKQVSPQRIIGVSMAVVAAVLYQFNVNFCPDYKPPPEDLCAPPKRASLRAVEGVANVARSSIKLTADDDAPAEGADEEEKELHGKRTSVRNPVS